MSAIIFLLLLHGGVVYFLWHDKEKVAVEQTKKNESLVFLSLPEPKPVAKPSPSVKQIPKKPPQKRLVKPSTNRSNIAKPLVPPEVSSPTIMSQIAIAKQKREVLEKEAEQQNKAAAVPSEDEIALERIKANIASANYRQKGVNGIFRVIDKGVQTGRFSFRGWINETRESTWKTYEVDAGLGGNVELALVRRMIQLIREHYSGNFNWESQRLGRVVVLSARPEDNARLEEFLMKEFF